MAKERSVVRRVVIHLDDPEQSLHLNILKLIISAKSLLLYVSVIHSRFWGAHRSHLMGGTHCPLSFSCLSLSLSCYISVFPSIYWDLTTDLLTCHLATIYLSSYPFIKYQQVIFQSIIPPWPESFN